MKPLAVWLDRFAEEACPGLDQALALAGTLVLRCFEQTPNPTSSRRLSGYRQVAVLGGATLETRRARVELATTTLTCPIIVLTTGDEPRALYGAGVVDMVRPALAATLAQRITLMSEVPVVGNGRGRGHAPLPPAPSSHPARSAEAPLQVVAVVSSTGGAFVAADLLRGLPRAGRAVLLAQHLAADFVRFFAEWLTGAGAWPVRVVEDAAVLEPGVVYLAAGGRDLVLEGARVVARVASRRHVPSGDLLLESVAKSAGARAVGVVLSGMGSDGASGLAALRAAGGAALCQTPGSSVVGSMPACALGAAKGARAVAPPALAAEVMREGVDGR